MAQMQREPKTQSGGSRGRGGGTPPRPPKKVYGGDGDDRGDYGFSINKDEDEYGFTFKNPQPNSGFIRGFIDTSKPHRTPQALDDMSMFERSRPIDPNKPHPRPRNINNPVSDGGNTSDSRIKLYGTPNMGDSRNPYSRSNEMPSRGDYMGRYMGDDAPY